MSSSVNESSVATLVEMGFGTQERCRQALVAVGGQDIEKAIGWLTEHPEGGDGGEPGTGGALGAAAAGEGEKVAEEGGGSESSPASATGESATGAAAAEGGGVARSIKCLDTGKLFKDMASAQIYAERTGHANFEECTEEVKPLTAEEKKKKVEELQEKIKEKRLREAQEEKRLAKERELKRRAGGQEKAKTADEAAAAQRKRDADARRREKMEFKKERERLRKQIELDKRERVANAGKLKSQLGVDGYNPVGQDLKGAAADSAAATSGDMGGGGGSAPAADPLAKMKSACNLLGQAKAGRLGETAIKTLRKYTTNILKNPDEPKFRRINLANEAFRKRVGSVAGGISFLKGLGFVKDETENALLLDKVDASLFEGGEKLLAEAFTRVVQ